MEKMDKERKGNIRKEMFLGIMAIGLGGYSLAGQMNLINVNVQIPQYFANVILTLSGFFLIVQSIKIAKHERYKTRFLG